MSEWLNGYHPAKRLSKEIIMDRPIAFHQLSFLAQRFIERRLQQPSGEENKNDRKDADTDSALDGHDGSPDI